MLTHLTHDEPCIITTIDGDSIAGIYGGVETPHGDWSVLVRMGRRTVSIPMECIEGASAA